MLVLMYGPSYGPRRWLEGADGVDDLYEDAARYSHLGPLERDLARLAHDPRPDLDQAALDAGERPVRDVFGQVCALEETAGIVGQGVKLEPDFVIAEPLAGSPGPVDRMLAFLDVLFGWAALVVKAHDPVRLQRQVGDEKKSRARKQIARVPLDLGKGTARLAP